MDSSNDNGAVANKKDDDNNNNRDNNDGNTGGGEFQLQVVSDIHLEFPNVKAELPAKGRYLGLLGDIGVIGLDAKWTKYKEYLLQQAERFEKVLVILGNHEYYHGMVDNVQQKVKFFCEEHKDKGLVYMQKTSVVLDGVRVLGTTLWSHVPANYSQEVARSLNDYAVIRVEDPNNPNGWHKLTVDETNAMHADEVQWIKSEVAIARELDQKVVVLTHHSPIADGSDPRFNDGPVNSAFCTNLESLMGPPIAVWAFGHTHWVMDVNRRGTRVLTNAMGYPHERMKAFDDDLVITV